MNQPDIDWYQYIVKAKEYFESHRNTTETCEHTYKEEQSISEKVQDTSSKPTNDDIQWILE